MIEDDDYVVINGNKHMIKFRKSEDYETAVEFINSLSKDQKIYEGMIYLEKRRRMLITIITAAVILLNIAIMS